MGIVYCACVCIIIRNICVCENERVSVCTISLGAIGFICKRVSVCVRMYAPVW